MPIVNWSTELLPTLLPELLIRISMHTFPCDAYLNYISDLNVRTFFNLKRKFEIMLYPTTSRKTRIRLLISCILHVHINSMLTGSLLLLKGLEYTMPCEGQVHVMQYFNPSNRTQAYLYNNAILTMELKVHLSLIQSGTLKQNTKCSSM
jgi:hypothetical protein